MPGVTLILLPRDQGSPVGAHLTGKGLAGIASGLWHQHGALAGRLGLGADLLDIGRRHPGCRDRDCARRDLGGQRRQFGELGLRRDGALPAALGSGSWPNADKNRRYAPPGVNL